MKIAFSTTLLDGREVEIVATLDKDTEDSMVYLDDILSIYDPATRQEIMAGDLGLTDYLLIQEECYAHAPA